MRSTVFKILLIVAFVLVAADLTIAFSTLARAADAVAVPPVSIPWGDYVAAFVGYFRDIILSVAGMAVASYAPAFAKQYLTNEVLGRAVDYAIAAIDGATHGKHVDVTLTNPLLEKAIEYAEMNAPSLAGKLGDTLRPKIMARLSAAGVLPPEVVIK